MKKTILLAAVFALLSGAAFADGNPSFDCSSSIATGTATQQICGGVRPTNGFAIYNSDAANDLWVSDSTNAYPNSAGSIRVVANGGGYETPAGYKPLGTVTVYGAVTGQKFTAKRW